MFKGLILALILAASPAGAQSARPTDATVQAEVEKRLTKQDLAEGNDIEVRVDDLIVFLDGSVQNLRQKRQATEAAMKADGASHVMNHLVVARGDRTDQQIADRVGRKVRSHPFYDIYDWIDGEVNDGVVTLRGWVREPWRKRQYEARLEELDGVVSIENEIGVLPVALYDDELRIAATRRIYGNPRFVRYASRSHPPIHIIVNRGRISLEGTVATTVERRLAETALVGLSALEIVNNLSTDAGL